MKLARQSGYHPTTKVTSLLKTSPPPQARKNPRRAKRKIARKTKAAIRNQRKTVMVQKKEKKKKEGVKKSQKMIDRRLKSRNEGMTNKLERGSDGKRKEGGKKVIRKILLVKGTRKMIVGREPEGETKTGSGCVRLAPRLNREQGTVAGNPDHMSGLQIGGYLLDDITAYLI